MYWKYFGIIDIIIFVLHCQIAVDEKFSEPLALIDLFGFRGEKTSSSSTYMGNIIKEKKNLMKIQIYVF